MINKTKICFWKRICPGSYRLGDIKVEQIWHSEGVCARIFMWHVIIDGKSIISYPYLKDAKLEAHKIDKQIYEGKS